MSVTCLGRSSVLRGLLYLMGLSLTAVPASAGEVYHHYFGNTHSHTRNSDGRDSTAEQHFRDAKAAGYDFYAVTDHALAKYKNFTPASYAETMRLADSFTDDKFVGICGFEYSENDGPGGKGHLTVLNSVGYLDATGKVNLPQFYDWLVTDQPTTVAASFNHPNPSTHNGHDYLTPARRKAVTMYEVINSGKPHYEGFLAALNKGWRVAPIAASDGHGTWRIPIDPYRAGVLATRLTREDIMQAIRARRVYCTWDTNLRVTMTANGRMMGSVLSKPSVLSFTISVSDPDTADPNDKITKIELIGDNGKLLDSKDFSAHTVTWSPICRAQDSYYFLRIYAADRSDSPTAYSAPVWVEKQ